jgi:hypothetical protein
LVGCIRYKYDNLINRTPAQLSGYEGTRYVENHLTPKGMKQKVIRLMNISRFALFFCIAAIFWVDGCATSTPDPLTGWRRLYSRDYEKFDAAVKEDYQHYIETLPHREKGFVGPVQFFQDGTGRHAVRIEIAVNGNDWAHVLIYDVNNRRIKVLHYISGRYRS